MNTLHFTPEQFSNRPNNAKVERELRNWILSQPVEERITFIKNLYLINYPFALIVLHWAQLPIKETKILFRYWLREGKHNTAQELIKQLVPMLGESTFWRIAAEEELPPAMKDFLNYHSHGRLDAEAGG
jgi:hypothetical protein